MSPSFRRSQAARRRLAVFGTVALGFLLSAAAAFAFAHPRPGATYRGTTYEAKYKYRGPNLSFNVTRNGRRITDFKNPHGRGGFGTRNCGGIWIGQPHNVPAPVIQVHPNGTFFGKRTARLGLVTETTTVDGHFTKRGNQAVGRIRYRQPANSHLSACNFNATFTVHVA
jgi:hypothetical protein